MVLQVKTICEKRSKSTSKSNLFSQLRLHFDIKLAYFQAVKKDFQSLSEDRFFAPLSHLILIYHLTL